MDLAARGQRARRRRNNATLEGVPATG
jgi:hypothetical protein